MIELRRLIAETESWLEAHKAAARAGHRARWVDAAASRIRLHALRQAMTAVSADKASSS